MSRQHDDERQPFWTVYTIFDPDGEGSDFAYTAGLAERGFPELHMWSRPCLGSDPGDDWMFSMRDNTRILNELAWQLLDGELKVGDTWSRAYDDDQVTAHFQLDPAQDAEDLDAFQAADGAKVLPVRWSLEREPVGEPQPMAAVALAAAQSEYAHLCDVLADRGPLPAGWELPESPDWSPTARFGPWTPLVLARAALVWTADPTEMVDIFYNILCVDMEGSLSWPSSVAASKARPLGRADGMRRLQKDIHETAYGFGKSWGKEASAALLTWMKVDSHDRDRTLRNVRGVLDEALHGFLCTTAVADALDVRVMSHGIGPILCGLTGPAVAPSPEWLAAPEVVAVLRSVAASLGVDGLASASLGWDRARHGDEHCVSLRSRVDARSVTSACFPPIPQEWMSFSTALMVKQRLHPEPLILAQGWGLVVTTVLTHRGDFSTEQIEAFVRISGNPTGLAEALNQPIVLSQSA